MICGGFTGDTILDEAAFFRSIAEQARDIILGVKLDGSICYANQAAITAYGYTLNELSQLKIRELRVPESRAELQGQLQKAWLEGILFRTIHMRKNGEHFPVEVSSQKVSLPHGEMILSLVRDITDVEKISAEARSAREFADNLIETANALLVKLDMAGQIVLFNDAAEQVTGYTRDEVIGKNWFATMLPDAGRPHMWDYFKKLTDPAFDKHYENPILTKSGEERYIVWQNNVVREQEKLTGMVCFGIDVTEKRRVEDALRREGEYIKGVMNGLAFPFFVVNRDHEYLVFNKAHALTMKRLFGVKIELGRSILDYHVNPGDREKVKKNLDQALQGNPCIIEDYVGDERFSRQYVLIEHNPVRDYSGEVLGVAVAVHDISQQKKAEDEIRASDLRYRQLVEDTHVIIIALGPEGKIGFVNDYGLKFLGYPIGELLGCSMEDALLPELETTGRNLREMYRTLWSAGDGELHETHENLLASGKRVWVDWIVRRGVNPLNGDEGWLCVGVDVTSARRAREEEKKGIERRRYNALMNDIRVGRITDERIPEVSRQLGINLAGPFICIVISKAGIGSSAEDEVQRQVEMNTMVDILKDQSEEIVWETEDGIAVLLPFQTDWSSETIKVVKQKTKAFLTLLVRWGYGKEIILGVSYQTLPKVVVAQLYDQALTALEWGPINNPGEKIYFWHELGWLRLLARDVNAPETLQFVADHLEPVLGISQPDKRELLLETLRDILSGESVESIARRLHVHPQTIRYRKRVLDDLFGEFITNGETATNLSIALKILSMQQSS